MGPKFRVILTDIPPDLLPSLVNLPKKNSLASRRLTPFGRPFEVGDRGRRRRKMEGDGKGHSGFAPTATQNCKPTSAIVRVPARAVPRSRAPRDPTRLDSDAQVAFTWLHGTLEVVVGQTRQLRAPIELPKNLKDDSHAPPGEEPWGARARRRCIRRLCGGLRRLDVPTSPIPRCVPAHPRWCCSLYCYQPYPFFSPRGF